MQNQSNNIVIIGGGFGGLSLVFNLYKKLKGNNEYKIILIDKNDYQLYYPDLYEVAASEEDFVSMQGLKKSITLDFKEILPKDVQFIQGEVMSINQTEKTIKLADQEIQFEYCVVAMGSTTEYYGMEGLEENTLTMKSLPDALKFRSEVELLVQQNAIETNKKTIRFVVGGGGFTGVELASELVNLLEILSVKYSYEIEKMEVVIVEAAQNILPGQDNKVVLNVAHRLMHLNIPIQLKLGVPIKSANDHQVFLANSEVINYDLLVWTGGIKPMTVPFVEEVKKDKRGRMVVDGFLNILGNKRVFCLGDMSCVSDGSGKSLPQAATYALAQSGYLADVLKRKIFGMEIKPFAPKMQPMIINVCGKWAAAIFPSGIKMYGFLPWLMHRYAAWAYFHRYMSFRKAWSKVWHSTKVYSENDM